jgi:hypothetical protein
MKKNKSSKNKYTFSISRFGGETVMGHITKEQYEYWKDKDEDLQEYVMGFDLSEYENEHDIPDEAKFDKQWFDIDNVVHICGGEIAKTQLLSIEEYDEDMNLIKSWDPIELDFSNLEKLGIQLSDYESYDIGHESVQDKYYFYGQAFNKGAWHTEEPISIPEELNLNKLVLNCTEVEGWLVCNSISYEGLDEEICLTEDSAGKSQTCSVHEGWRNN